VLWTYLRIQGDILRQLTKLLAVGATAALALTACGGSSSSPTTSDSAGASSPSVAAKATVGLAYDIGGRGDKSFNDSAAAGLDKAKAELGLKTQELEATTGESNDQKAARLRLLAQAGDDPVIAVGFAYAVPLGIVAKEFPNTHFAIIDDASNTAAGLLPGRGDRGSGLEVRAHRLHRWGRGPADQEVLPGVRGRRQGGQPGDQDRVEVSDPSSGLLRFR
jgi:hypothetical protein